MNSAENVIIVDPYPRDSNVIFSAEDKRRLEGLGRVIWHTGSRAPDAQIDRHLPDAIALLGYANMPRERLDRAPHLKLIVNVEGNFLPNIDYEECFRRNIYVTAIAPVFAASVSEMALGMAIAAARGMVDGDRKMRAGTESLYGVEDTEDSFLLRGKTMGVIGCGNLGRALIPMLRPFLGAILAHDPWIHEHILHDMQLHPLGLEELFRRSRVVFILAPPTTDNAGSLDKKYFSLMQRGSVVVLVSRAGIVNFDDLLDACESGHIRAAIDVFPEEPIPPDHRARRTPNTILSAHRAGNVPEIMHEIGKMIVDDVELVLRGLPPQRMQHASFATAAKYRSTTPGSS